MDALGEDALGLLNVTPGGHEGEERAGICLAGLRVPMLLFMGGGYSGYRSYRGCLCRFVLWCRRGIPDGTGPGRVGVSLPPLLVRRFHLPSFFRG